MWYENKKNVYLRKICVGFPLYEVQVKTVCGQENSNWSSRDTVTTLDCGIPTNIMAQNITGTIMTIHWNPVMGATEYKLKYKRSDQNNWTNVNHIVANSYNLTGLQTNTWYEFKVRSNCQMVRMGRVG